MEIEVDEGVGFATGVQRALRALTRSLWPSRCALCGQVGQAGIDLCTGCDRDLLPNDHGCEHCAEPLPPEIARPTLCGACLQHPPAFDACVAPFRYAFPVDRMIQGLKYRRELYYGRVLGQLLCRHVAHRKTRPELVIPVPLAKTRYRDRGFNQARELARPLCKSLGLRLCSDLVERRRETQVQAGLNRKERLANTRDAFALLAPLPARHVAIIDDVVTTGSTVNEVAKLLRSAGAEWIEVWAAARA
jgi:ComF family protein